MELQSWLDHRVFDLVKKKFVDQERESHAREMGPDMEVDWKGKSTSVCVGLQDPDLTEVPRDSPTLSTASEALIMQWVAPHKYRLISGDIKTAFLSGDEDVRNIFISPPDDVREMLNLDNETVLRLRKAVIGKCAKEMVGQTQEIAHRTWIHKLCPRSMCICSSNKLKHP